MFRLGKRGAVEGHGGNQITYPNQVGAPATATASAIASLIYSSLLLSVSLILCL
jgi:hypothetical protein